MSNELSTLPSRTAIGLVARREFLNRARSRAFIVSLATTVFLVFVVFGVSKLLDDGPTELTVGVVGPQPSGLSDALADLEDSEDGAISLSDYEKRDTAVADLEDGTIDAVVVDGAEVVVVTLDDDVTGLILPTWQQARVVGGLVDAGADPSVIAEIQTPLVITETTTNGDAQSRQALAFGMTIVLLIAVQVGGSFLMMGVLEETGTKVIEIVLSSIRPRDLLAGKLLGIGGIGVVQVVVMVAAALTASGAFDADVLSVLTPAILIAAVAWFLVGYLLWGSLYTAASSLATGMEDAQSSLTPVTIGVLISYFLAIFASNEPTSLTAQVASWVPFVAPFAMPARMAAVDTPWWEVVGALVLAAATTVGVLRIAERIYLRSVLQVDRRVSWREALIGNGNNR
jgi:ABC-2 type transport system permease protein